MNFRAGGSLSDTVQCQAMPGQLGGRGWVWMVGGILSESEKESLELDVGWDS